MEKGENAGSPFTPIVSKGFFHRVFKNRHSAIKGQSLTHYQTTKF